MAPSNDLRFTIFLITFGILAVLILIAIITLPLILRSCPCKKRKLSHTSTDLDELLSPSSEFIDVSAGSQNSTERSKKNYSNTTNINCVIEYRTRSTHVVVRVENLLPASNARKFKQEASGSKIFLLVYIDGDVLNRPCESRKHDLKKEVCVNESFAFTVMPYDLCLLYLVIQTIVICGHWKYEVGTLTFPLNELDQNASYINKVHQLPYPLERCLVHECLLSLSIMKSKHTIKFKIVKLYFLESSFIDQPKLGLHLRIQITDFQNPLQIFDTTKKKYQRCVTFNELTMFQFAEPLSSTLEIEIQLMQSNDSGDEHEVSVCGRTVLYTNKIESMEHVSINRNDAHLMEVYNSPDVEVVRWHTIPYVHSNK